MTRRPCSPDALGGVNIASPKQRQYPDTSIQPLKGGPSAGRVLLVGLLVHLAREDVARRIARSGIQANRFSIGGVQGRGVFATPRVPSYYVSHQWLREVRRTGGQLVAINFRVPDKEHLLVGHYNSQPIETTAAQAAAVILNAEDPRGYQVVVPRRISAREIHNVRRVSQVVGWRYKPDAHGERPCACPICLPSGSER